MDKKSNGENIIHRQRFQNAANSVEVIVRSKPKSKLNSLVKSKDKSKFSRNCLLKAELDKYEECEKENMKDNVISKKTEKFTGLEIYKKSKSSGKQMKRHKFLNPNESWGEFLDKKKETKSLSLIQESSQNYEITNSYEETSNSNYSSVYSMVDQAVQTSFIRNPYRNSERNEDHLDENISSKGIFYPDGFCQEKIDQIRGSIDKNYTFKQSHDKVSGQKQLMNGIPDDVTSEDQTHSPFGASGLLLLRQLREKLRSRGDSENSDIVELLEALMSVSSSDEKTKIRNKLGYGSSSTQHYPSVFETPRGVNNEVVDRLNNQIKEQDAKILEDQQAIKELKEFSARLLIHYEETTKNILPKDFPEHDISRKIDDDEAKIMKYEKLNGEMKMKLDSLLEENRQQKDIITKLELKLSSYENEQRFNAKISDRQNIPSSLSDNLSVQGINNVDSASRFLTELNNQNNLPQRENNIPINAASRKKKDFDARRKVESDGDSAFDEDRSSNTEIQRIQCDTGSSRGTSNLSHYGNLVQSALPVKSMHNGNLGVSNKKGKGPSQITANDDYPYGIKVIEQFPLHNIKNIMSDVSDNLSLTLGGYSTHDNTNDVSLESDLPLGGKVALDNKKGAAYLSGVAINQSISNYPPNDLHDESYISDSPIVLNSNKYLESTHLKQSQLHSRPVYSMHNISSEYFMEPIEVESTRASC